jgi:hypothetical protein
MGVILSSIALVFTMESDLTALDHHEFTTIYHQSTGHIVKGSAAGDRQQATGDGTGSLVSRHDYGR